LSQIFAPFLWVAVSLPLLLLLQRWIHRHLHGLAYLITGNKNWAVVLYAIVLFPGVLLHELSHWLTAALLGVRTGSLSLLPRAKADGTIQLGYVEYYKTGRVGPVRESLIGSAPLITGTAVLLLIALHIFDIPELVTAYRSGDGVALARALSVLFATADFALWMYLLFAVSNAMMPSAADRRAWPVFALVMLVAALVLYLLGFQETIGQLANPAATVFNHIGLALSLAIGVDLFFIFVIYVLEWSISRMKGVDLVYGRPE
jgi:hypothetical protein